MIVTTRMDRLAAIRSSVDWQAIYDLDSHANLINTAKYSQLYDDMCEALVSVPEFRQVRRVDDVAKTLMYAKSIYNLWLTDAWKSVFYSDLYGWDMSNFYSPYHHPCQTEFEWICSHREVIDSYAVQGTKPTASVIRHFVNLYQHHITESVYDSRSRPYDFKVLRNLHRFMDAVTLYAYWTIMQTYELWGERLMTKRLQIALDDDRYIHYTGTLCTLPKNCLESVYEHLSAIPELHSTRML